MLVNDREIRMSKPAGLVVRLDPSRFAIFDDLEYDSFAEPVGDFAHPRHLPLMCFVVVGDRLAHLCTGRRGIRAGTGLRRLNLVKSFALRRHVSIDAILATIPPSSKSFAEKRFTQGGLLPPATFQSVLQAVLTAAPETADTLNRFLESRLRRIERISSAAREALAEQQQAVLTSLAIAGIDREDVGPWDLPNSGAPTSFLDGLSSVRLREDQMVINDLDMLPGFDALKRHSASARTFLSDTAKVTVILANRLPLEEQTGTDLIYYNETFKCFLMIQYKAMEKEGDDHVFRFPQPQLDKEIERMNVMLATLSRCARSDNADSYRLSENPFFLKICPRIVFNPDSLALVPGMYLPLDYWKRISEHPDTLGSKGGRFLSYRNVRRHLDNTKFIAIAGGGWIGTTIPQSEQLEVLIRDVLNSGRALVFTIKEKRKRDEPTSDPESDFGSADGMPFEDES